jgi:hypothetical protein
MSAKQEDQTLRLTLGSGLRANAPLHVSWPTRRRPTEVTVDGRKLTTFDANGALIQRPFRDLIARW